MCIELHTRCRRCTHTRLLHWTYCPILPPSSRQPSTGRSCRRYKLRYKESSDTTADCFECKLSEIAGWGAMAKSPTCSNFSERSPTMASFLNYGGRREPGFPTFRERSPTVTTFVGAAGLLGVGSGSRESKDSEVSVVASEETLSLGVGNWRASGDSKEILGKEPDQEVKEGGVKGWFKKIFKAREGYDSGVFGFQWMDA